MFACLFSPVCFRLFVFDCLFSTVCFRPFIFSAQMCRGWRPRQPDIDVCGKVGRRGRRPLHFLPLAPASRDGKSQSLLRSLCSFLFVEEDRFFGTAVLCSFMVLWGRLFLLLSGFVRSALSASPNGTLSHTLLRAPRPKNLGSGLVRCTPAF